MWLGASTSRCGAAALNHNPISVDIRLLAATNRDLKAAAAGREIDEIAALVAGSSPTSSTIAKMMLTNTLLPVVIAADLNLYLYTHPHSVFLLFCVFVRILRRKNVRLEEPDDETQCF